MIVDKRGYELINILCEDQDCLDEVEERIYEFASDDMDTIITEVCESYIPIFYNDIWKDARNIKDYINDSLNHSSEQYDIEVIIQNGYNEYFTQLICNNLKNILWNCAVDYLDTLVEDNIISEEDMSDDFENILEHMLNSLDGSSECSQIKVIVDNLLESVGE